MRFVIFISAFIIVLLGTGQATASGELYLYNWSNYTSPELITKFENETGIKVTVGDYDSNDTLLAKIKAGGHGYDVAVPSDNMVKIMIDEDLVQEAGVNEMENFKNLDPKWLDVYFDPGRKFSAPWQWGSTGISLNTSYYDGPKADSWALLFDPPEELVGRINMVSEMAAVMIAGLFYLDLDKCNSDKDDLKRLNELLVSAKEKWRTIDDGVIEKLTSGDVYASLNWNGASMRARLQVPTIKYVMPKEGLPAWSDNVVLLKEAKNIDEAKTFMNFIMAPENAALISNFARYANGIKGSGEFMDPEMAAAPEIIGYPGEGAPEFIPPCSQEVIEIYTKIWNNLLK